MCGRNVVIICGSEHTIRQTINTIYIFLETFAFITKLNSTKHYLQCQTHDATLLTEQYLRYLQGRLLILAIQINNIKCWF